MAATRFGDVGYVVEMFGRAREAVREADEAQDGKDVMEWAALARTFAIMAEAGAAMLLLAESLGNSPLREDHEGASMLRAAVASEVRLPVADESVDGIAERREGRA